MGLVLTLRGGRDEPVVVYPNPELEGPNEEDLIVLSLYEFRGSSAKMRLEFNRRWRGDRCRVAQTKPGLPERIRNAEDYGNLCFKLRDDDPNPVLVYPLPRLLEELEDGGTKEVLLVDIAPRVRNRVPILFRGSRKHYGIVMYNTADENMRAIARSLDNQLK
ncbi:hypothetical protein GF386_05995 [Candidatus Pacearchaeota archaeon]|nr:hypothetical protein [Candidatus Pacearchaeota archaeon]MBD3283644.1 hypothetical protein [Candidatus Pacearchaeota archaeon]